MLLQLRKEPFSGLRSTGASTRTVDAGVLVAVGAAGKVGVAVALAVVDVGVGAGVAAVTIVNTWPTRSRRASFKVV